MMKKCLSTTAIIMACMLQSIAQCSLTASANRDTITCGDHVLLSVFGRGQGQNVFTENFNSGTPSGWAFTQQATFTNPCSPGGVDGTPHIWMGNNSGVPRTLQTQAYDFSAATAGATICFDLLMAAQGGTSPCEGPDEPDEGVYLQYRIGNGTWITINYFDPNGGNDAQLTNWNNWCFQLPAGALTSNVSIRWFQDNDSGADYDHWGIDNVQIYFNDPTFTIAVTNNGTNVYTFPQGSSGGALPNSVSPRTTTTYTFTMQNSSGVTCRDSITIFVRSPEFQVNAGNDTTICSGNCAVLNATAKVIKSPAKIATYRNIQPDTADASSFGGLISQGAIVNINVRNLNMNNVQPGSIASVCIDRVRTTGFGLGGAALSFYLICPDGTSIRLMPTNQATGNAGLFGYNTLFQNICFVPAGPVVSSGTPPYSSSFGTEQPFDNLVGCTANGVWQLSVVPGGTFAGGSIIITGWSITFNDPEIAYTGNFVWSPTTNMTGSNTLTPSVCPPIGVTTYRITVSDTANCSSLSDSVRVTVQNCCNFTLQAGTTQPTCGQSNGSISITPVPAGNYSYNWGGGVTTQNRTGLAAGTYTVTVTDVANNCTRDTTITLNSNSNLLVAFSNPVNPTCAGNDGSIQVTLSGGNAPYQISIDTGGTPINITSPIAISQTVTNLPAGNIDVTVTDGQGCVATASASLTPPANCCQFTIQPSFTQPTCGQSNGSASVTISNGSGNYTYNWSSGSTTASAGGLGAGTVRVTVTDNGQGCSKDTSVVLSSNSTLSLNTANITNPTCAGNDGSFSVTLSGGSAPYDIQIDTGNGNINITSPIAGSQNITGLNAGSITISVTDAQSCTANASVNLVAPSNCCQFTFTSAVVSPNCGVSDGSISVTVQNGSGNYSYQWSNASTASSISGISAGNYSVTITDNGFSNCTKDSTFTLSNANAPVVDNINVTPASCPGVNNGAINLSVSGGAGNYTYIWNTGGSINPLPNLTGNTNYQFTVTDGAGCQTVGTAFVGSGTGIVANLGNDTVICLGGSIVVDGTTPGAVSYAWSISSSNAIITVIDSGRYVLTVTDANGCTASDDKLVRFGGEFSVNIAEPVEICPGGSAAANIILPASNVQYFWSTGATGTQITVNDIGIYSVTAIAPNGCAATDTLNVVYAPPITIYAGDTVDVYEGQSVTLNTTTTASTNGASYVWTPDSWLNCTSCPAPTASVPDDITYTVQITDSRGCMAIDNVVVRVIGDFYAFMPNAFTPNGDGNNDILIPAVNGAKLIEWKVFDRWGEKVFQSNSVTMGWDGTYKGRDCPIGNYVYIMNVVFLNDRTEKYKGGLLLLR